MKIYNKFVESKKEPYNKNDIWFDGSSWKMYKEGMWRAFTLPLDAAVEINKILQEDKSILQSEITRLENRIAELENIIEQITISETI